MTRMTLVVMSVVLLACASEGGGGAGDAGGDAGEDERPLDVREGTPCERAQDAVAWFFVDWDRTVELTPAEEARSRDCDCQLSRRFAEVCDFYLSEGEAECLAMSSDFEAAQCCLVATPLEPMGPGFLESCTPVAP